MLRRILRDNGLTLVVMIILFMPALVGQSVTGYRVYNADQVAHQQSTVGYTTYLTSGHFVEATFENWESEFLQMGLYVLLTVGFRQRGSSESKPLDESDPVDEDPDAHRRDPKAPWPVRRGGWVLTLYKNSLSLVFFVLFLVSFGLHAYGGSVEFSADQLAHGGSPVSVFDYLGTSHFWFESFQNWQSEFLSIGAIVVFSIFLRQYGSPESKPVAAPHSQTGSS
jgi:hypothetical protein